MAKFCSNCGEELNENSKCEKCGKVSVEGTINGLFNKVKSVDYKATADELKSKFTTGIKEKTDFLEEGERLVMEGAANKRQLGGLASKGGTLFLTDRRVVFKTGALNIGAKFEEIKLSDIVMTDNHLNFLMPTPNMIQIVLKDGTNHGFIVTGKQKDEWREKIAEVTKCYQEG